jgi:hypothetical protein
MNATLTATGVIATILSVVFAIAAYFVQRKKNNSGRSGNAVSLGNPEEEAHVVTTRHGVSKEMKRHGSTAEGVVPPPPAPPPKTEVPGSGQKQVFRKYSAKGVAESEAVIEDEDEVLWE